MPPECLSSGLRFAQEQFLVLKGAAWTDYIWPTDPPSRLELVNTCDQFIQDLKVFFKRVNSSYFQDEPRLIDVEHEVSISGWDTKISSHILGSGSTTPEKPASELDPYSPIFRSPSLSTLSFTSPSESSTFTANSQSLYTPFGSTSRSLFAGSSPGIHLLDSVLVGPTDAGSFVRAPPPQPSPFPSLQSFEGPPGFCGAMNCVQNKPVSGTDIRGPTANTSELRRNARPFLPAIMKSSKETSDATSASSAQSAVPPLFSLFGYGFSNSPQFGTEPNDDKVANEDGFINHYASLEKLLSGSDSMHPDYR
jgi:hypothetical protein